ncbi:MAG: ATP-dependent DNA helicase RecG [Clostridiales bacterium]|nr:ATP-dependent DNA helicase RecG [Clostridiales bacterium]MDY4173478.1 ATP-dependent DNA helicase RecG [Evtepia sp.]
MAELTLHTPLSALAGVGPAREKALGKLGLFTVADLLAYFPREYEDRTVREGIATLPAEEPVCFSALVAEPFRTSYIRRGMELTKGRIVDGTGQVDVTFFNQSYVRQALQVGETYYFYGKLTGAGYRRQMASPYFEKAGQASFTGGIMPVYPLTAGIANRFLSGLTRRALSCLPQIRETLPAGLREAYQLAPAAESYANIHYPASWGALAKARRRLMFEELFCLNLGLALIRGRRGEQQAIPFVKQNLAAFTGSLPFSLTGAQRRSVEEAAADLGRPVPMNRLLQGDVGSGKTVVAAACAYFAWQNGCQVALMAPTELLAQQHRRTMEELLGGTGLRVGLLIGSMTAAQKRACHEALEAGEIDLIVGTHALLSQGVAFRRLGLVITDEQHRFGVDQRAALAAKSGGDLRPHVLVMSATPIPRTLALMIYGDLDLSVIDELPPGRTPVATYLVGEDKRRRLYGFVRKQVAQGRQVYIVCPAVDQEDQAGMKAAQQYGRSLQEEVFPDLRVSIVHGKLRPKEKQAVMASFVAGQTDVLVSTTVIEVGVDVPNANLMVIENAERFGLSQLHQLRGRVGRGKHQSYCVLLSDHPSEGTRQRLKALTATNDGFAIAEEDLKQRGPGDFFGARQSGLPQLKLASLEGDMRLLHQAQGAARDLLAQDPHLRQPEHAPLRGRVEQLFRENRDIFN